MIGVREVLYCGERSSFDKLRMSGGVTLTPALSQDGRGGRREEGDRPAATPPWVPAFAGMTKKGERSSFDKLRMSGGVTLTPALSQDGRGGRREEGDRPAATPPWVPAFAGMTKTGERSSFDKLRMSGGMNG